MLEAVSDEVAYEWDVVRYVAEIPLAVLEEVGAPESIIQRKQWMLEPHPEATEHSKQAPPTKDAPPDLGQILGLPREQGDPLILTHARELKNQASNLDAQAKAELLTRLDEWWPAGGFASAITFETRTSWKK